MTRLILRHPFFCLALLSGVAFGASMLLWRNPDHADAAWAMFQVWYWLGYPFSQAASWLQAIAPDLPGWLDKTLIIVIGLPPYLIADWLLGRIRCACVRRHAAGGNRADEGRGGVRA